MPSATLTSFFQRAHLVVGARALVLACLSLGLTASDDQTMGQGYLALGDSYTIGEGVEDSGRWPGQLAAHLIGRGVALDAPIIVAKTGWTTRDLIAGVQSTQPRGPFSLVTVQIGVNDQYRGGDCEHFRSDLRRLLMQAIGLAGGHAARVIAVSIPDWGVTPFAGGRDVARISTAIDAFNTVVREESAGAGVAYVSVTESSRAAGNDTALLVADGLHPSSILYERWVALIAPIAEAALRNR